MVARFAGAMLVVLVAGLLLRPAVGSEGKAVDVSADSTSNMAPKFVSSNTKEVLFSTSINVDGVAKEIKVCDGDTPAMVARDFAVLHGLTVGSMKQVLKHLKGQALAKGLYKRVFFHLPVAVQDEKTKKNQVLNMTIYEDSEPEDLAAKVGKLHSMLPGQIKALAQLIERNIVEKIKLRTVVDLTSHGVGKQTLLVKNDETALSATQNFARFLQGVGIDLSEEGIKVLSVDVEAQMMKVAVAKAMADSKAAAEAGTA